MNGESTRAAVFLDRDGVLNRSIVLDGVPHPPESAEQIEILPGVAEATKLLAGRGFLLIGVTNQPDVARGTQTRQEVERINEFLKRQLALDAIYVCFHDNADRCTCRKPRPGLILQAAADHHIDLGRSFMVGDRWSDVVAGGAAGCRTLLIRCTYNQRQRCSPEFEVADLLEAARIIVTQ